MIYYVVDTSTFTAIDSWFSPDHAVSAWNLNRDEGYARYFVHGTRD